PTALLDALVDPHRAYPVLHVAGTNGKGSSLATAEALLRSRGLRVGKYTSPHLVDFRERILVSGVPIEADAIVDFVERWTPLVERLGATFFEATTALAFDAFAKRSEEHTSELQSHLNLVCRLLLEKKNDILNEVLSYSVRQ